MEIFGRELTIDQIISLVKTHAPENTDDLIYMAAAELAEEVIYLTSALASCERSERAAMDDLKTVCVSGETCVACKHCCDMGDGFPCRFGEWCKGDKWEWRGPSEKGE